MDVRDLDKTALRRNIGVALQESVLFSGTIRDNIRYGRPEATRRGGRRGGQGRPGARVYRRHSPMAMTRELGQRGVNLSGGQKQRVAIARALLTQPAVLILDDSTSSVDVETETKIQEALEELMTGPHQLCDRAAHQHRAQRATRSWSWTMAQIAAEGTHRELLASSPIYREIYDSQLGNGATNHV